MKQAGSTDPAFFCPYERAVSTQHELVAERIAGRIGDTLLLVEHEPVVTLGSSAKEEHLLLSREEYSGRGIKILKTDRGGDVTYHGPGQLVCYPIIKLPEEKRDPHAYLFDLEAMLLRTLAHFSIEAFRKKGCTGAWTEHGKIAAVGVYLKRWVTYHGCALNVGVDFSGFASIIPCGLSDRRVTSIAREKKTGEAPSLDEVAAVMEKTCREVFHTRFSVLKGSDLTTNRAEGLQEKQ